jgi:hypothetical protein
MTRAEHARVARVIGKGFPSLVGDLPVHDPCINGGNTRKRRRNPLRLRLK